MKKSFRNLLLSVVFSVLFFPLFAQTITTVDPDSAYQGQQNLQVSISGTNLNFNQGTSVIVWLKQGNDSITSYSSQLASPNSAYAVFNFSLSATTGYYDLYCFYAPTSQTTILQNGFHILGAQPAPGVPVLISPSANATLDNTVVSFDWDVPLNAIRYELIVDDDISFTSPLIHQLNLQTSNYNNSNLSFLNGLYYWKVRAINISEISGNWSAVKSFTVDASPQIISAYPDNGYVGQTNLSVEISGVNTHFEQGTNTIDCWLQQQAYTITPLGQTGFNPFDANIDFNIPGSAPTGYYDVSHNDLGDTITLFNGFYLHESNQYSGTMFIDANNNQVFDMGEVPYPQGIISNSFNSSYALTQSDGSYEGYVPPGTYNLTVANPPHYYTTSPSQHTVTYSGTGGTDSGNDFAIYPIPGVHDLSIYGSVHTARIGMPTYIYFFLRNTGPFPDSGQVSLTIPQELIVDSATNPYTLIDTVMTLDFTDLQPFEFRQMRIYLFVPLAVQADTYFTFPAEISSSSGQDTVPYDNNDYFTLEVNNSYDPNIKEVSPAAGLTPQQVQDGEYLEYTIHFQNTGTADAINIRILDTLNPFLDITTFEVLGASHPWQTRLLDNRLVEFRFDNIHLPDSNANEMLSHGYIKYRIKPTSLFAVGNQIENTAYIYFDFNEAVVTNTTNTTIITGVEEQATSNLNLLVSPNPFNTQTNISYSIPQSGFVDIKLYNCTGQFVKLISGSHRQMGNHKVILNTAELPGGVYFIALNCNSVNDLKKVVLIK